MYGQADEGENVVEKAFEAVLMDREGNGGKERRGQVGRR